MAGLAVRSIDIVGHQGQPSGLVLGPRTPLFHQTIWGILGNRYLQDVLVSAIVVGQKTEEGNQRASNHLYHSNLTDAMVDPRSQPLHDIRNVMHGKAFTLESPPRLHYYHLIKVLRRRRSAVANVFHASAHANEQSETNSGSFKSFDHR